LPRSATRSAAAPTSGHARRRGIEAHEPVPPLAYLSVHRRRPTDCSWVGTPSDAELHGQAAGRPARLPIHPLTFGDVAVALVPGAGAPLKQTLLALRGGRHLAAHDAPGAATLQVLRGRVRSSKEALGARSKSWRASGPPKRWTRSTYLDVPGSCRRSGGRAGTGCWRAAGRPHRRGQPRTFRCAPPVAGIGVDPTDPPRPAAGHGLSADIGPRFSGAWRGWCQRRRRTSNPLMGGLAAASLRETRVAEAADASRSMARPPHGPRHNGTGGFKDGT
jgi:hypothetical protein